jgi:hypothetical protein
MIPKQFCLRFAGAFERLFQQADQSAVISLAEEVLRPNGGFLFDGYRGDAPAEWRKPDGQKS